MLPWFLAKETVGGALSPPTPLLSYQYHRWFRSLSRSTWNIVIAAFRAPWKFRMIFYNFCYYFWGQHCSSFVWASCSFIHCLTTLEFGAGVEQPFGCLIVQNRQAVQSVGRSMDWTLEDNMVDGLFFCATLTGRRGGHTPFVQSGAEMSDTGAVAVKPDPGCLLGGSFRGPYLQNVTVFEKQVVSTVATLTKHSVCHSIATDFLA